MATARCGRAFLLAILVTAGNKAVFIDVSSSIGPGEVFACMCLVFWEGVATEFKGRRVPLSLPIKG